MASKSPQNQQKPESLFNKTFRYTARSLGVFSVVGLIYVSLMTTSSLYGVWKRRRDHNAQRLAEIEQRKHDEAMMQIDMGPVIGISKPETKE
eukprot:CAMPEP_0184693984 /NCGR_PEP_ID=MMETSP0313-20130426/2068_1 /TAXON_ID=2792 /ORGANISM="Porphyridium aerugineum, Strain SAG 1380-2" /LENGTH=91 /DNA_ID=CAMNT_0027152183 /DNA_START=219 /DNA_END=494 /DNA_ORIENTATION=+